MTTVAVAPKGIVIEAIEDESGTWTVKHTEHFRDGDRQALANCVNILRSVGVSVEHDDLTFIATYPGVSMQTMGNIVCGEFMQWATIFDMKLRDLMTAVLAVGYAGGQNNTREDSDDR